MLFEVALYAYNHYGADDQMHKNKINIVHTKEISSHQAFKRNFINGKTHNHL